MMRVDIKLCWLLLMILFAGACSGAKRTVQHKAKERSQQYVLKQLEEKRIEASHFNAKAKIRFDDGYQRMSFNAQVRMERDSFIWITANFLTYEVARLLIRPDSIFVINRLEKTYLADSYDGFDSTFHIPVAFDQLQDLLYGNTLLAKGEPAQWQFTADRYQVTQQLGSFLTLHQIDASRFVPKEIAVDDAASGYSVDLKLEDYKPLDNSGDFSYFREYIIKNHNVHFANIQLNFLNIDTDQRKKAPFEIPDHYARAD